MTTKARIITGTVVDIQEDGTQCVRFDTPFQGKGHRFKGITTAFGARVGSKVEATLIDWCGNRVLRATLKRRKRETVSA